MFVKKKKKKKNLNFPGEHPRLDQMGAPLPLGHIAL